MLDFKGRVIILSVETNVTYQLKSLSAGELPPLLPQPTWMKVMEDFGCCCSARWAIGMRQEWCVGVDLLSNLRHWRYHTTSPMGNIFQSDNLQSFQGNERCRWTLVRFPGAAERGLFIPKIIQPS